ncbi:hypothetical protein Y900_024150 [Mycolicibacterium aromaticivorans JS19b1 = JCM 16368]|uniref:Phage capsid-like C-terminal domain-containing protein n=1 Tax=Mycolicibacterium aromaticivorans JS19b1 = JCM 16368 TaxID=1440774 RepID=A0A064CN03_9MYCO|nr:phage major capsid protein [Mycolicibacterium aromaticivorans]KDF01935.1 hypothetical protein Y900_024150 [Mycolicibacterium aromaticivorans JS19b1 = JCM 16368]
MALYTTGAGAILTPEQIGELVVKPFTQQSVAMRVSTVVPIDSASLRVPVVSADPAASFVAEGAEITASDPTVTEVNIVAKKLAALTVISSELAADSSPAALGVVGDGIVRDLARKTDAAYFGNTTTNGPAGLLSLAAGDNDIDAGDTWSNLDWAEAAKTNAEQHNTVVTAFVASPATVLKIAQIKQYASAGSNVPLLQADPTSPAARVVAGVPLLSSPAIADDIVWAIPAARSVVALRSGTQVVPDSSVYFTSDRVALRGILRVGWGFTDPGAVSKIAITP